MTVKYVRMLIPCATAMVAIAILALTVEVAGAAPIPNKFLPFSHIGLRVDKTTGGNVCTVASKDECVEPPQENFEPVEVDKAGAFHFPRGVAVAPTGNVYVADTFNHRVKELDAAGNFILMFGKEVNKKGGNVCTQAEESECQSGAPGSAPGQFGFVESIAVDPTSGDVYVTDITTGESGGEPAEAQRVQKFTAGGTFLLEIGKEVNETTKGNLCTAAEACKGAALRTQPEADADSGLGAFSLQRDFGNLLAVGGPEDMLYVGDHARVQKFNASGASAGEVSLAALSASGRATGVAVDPAGDVFVSDNEAPGIHEYNAAGVLQPQVIDAASSGVQGMALDSLGRLGIIESEGGPRHGVLYGATGAKISEFAPPSGELPGFPVGLAFASSDELYVAEPGRQEIEAYKPVAFPEARTCAASEVTPTSAKLCGEINPDGVPTTGFFQYGTTPSLGSLTPVVFEGGGETFVPVPFQLTGLEPNQAYQYRVAVEAEAGGEKMQGHGEEAAFRTPAIPPLIPGAPSASFVKVQSVILSSALNPEHLATRYHFEYGACPALAGCASVQSAPEESSSVYGLINPTQEIVGLAPGTTYSFRLVANNEQELEGKTVGGKAIGAEGRFTTAPGPVPRAETGAYGAVTATSAIISGMVDPDGLPASYAFELGVYNGASTQYGVVFSGSAGSGNIPVEEAFALSGLQPGTTYAYRVTVSSGYISNGSHTVQGAPGTFTTSGLPSVLTVPPLLAQLPIPNIAFPKATSPGPKKKKVKASQKKHRKAKTKKKHKKARKL